MGSNPPPLDSDQSETETDSLIIWGPILYYAPTAKVVVLTYVHF